MSSIINIIKEEFNSYSRNIKISLAVLAFFTAGFFIFAIQILFGGLGYTDMNNIYAFGQWIIGDLGLVALGGGAFTTGFLLYIFRSDKLEPIINSTVLIGFLCYLFTLIFLVFDIGQPIRAWFIYIYPNWGPHLMPRSMLAEVSWCLAFYFMILCVELVPIVLKQKILDAIPVLHYFGHYLHKLMWIFAAAGTFLSFFHQGSLGGGMWSVLYGKAQWFRPHHNFFYTVIIAATAGGTAFMTLCAYTAGKVMKKEVVPKETFQSMLKISGVMFIVYLIFRIYDIGMMQHEFAPLFGRKFTSLFGGYYGLWMIVLEFVLIISAVVLFMIKKFREQEKFMRAGLILAVSGIITSKLTVIMHGSSTPNFPWREFASYNPTYQEWFILLGGLSIMILVYMWAAKYLPLFPHLAKQEHDAAGE